MSQPYIGEIRAFGFHFAPRDWALCNGQLVSIAQNNALFAILGTIYGGDGVTTFGLPNLQDRSPMHWGNGPGLTPRVLGEVLGSSTVTLLNSNLPPHNHTLVTAAAKAASDSGPTPNSNAFIGTSGFAQMYNSDQSVPPNAPLAPNAIGLQGGSQPHQNMQPILTLNCCIALYGIFPSRN